VKTVNFFSKTVGFISKSLQIGPLMGSRNTA